MIDALTMIETGLEVLVVVVLADFVSGFVHWAEDSWGSPSTPFIGKSVIEPNLRHHARPREFLANSYWESSRELWAIGAVIAAAAWGFDALDWHVVLFVVLAANANQFHKWTHRAPHENGRLITTLQRLRVLQTQRHHGGHHSGLKNTHYCTVTNFVNPVLDGLRVWRGLEWLVEAFTGVRPRVDPTVRVNARTVNPPSRRSA